MSIMPKLKVTREPVGYPKEEIMELEEAKYRLNYDETTILVEGRYVRGHEELIEMINETDLKNKELIEITTVVLYYAGS